MPVILFSPMPTGHHFGGTGPAAAGGNDIPPMEFGLSMVCTVSPATKVNVNIWPTGGNTITGAMIGFNAAAGTALALTPISVGSPGRKAEITLAGIANDRNVLNVSASDSAGVTSTGSVTYYLRATMTLRKPRKPVKKPKRGRK